MNYVQNQIHVNWPIKFRLKGGESLRMVNPVYRNTPNKGPPPINPAPNIAPSDLFIFHVFGHILAKNSPIFIL